jgi:hypothetical protein
MIAVAAQFVGNATSRVQSLNRKANVYGNCNDDDDDNNNNNNDNKECGTRDVRMIIPLHETHDRTGT